jgi:hexokinase
MAPTPRNNGSELPAEVTAIEKFFYLNKQKLETIVEGFCTEFQEGLQNFGKDTAMIPSYCLNVPDGSEKG